MAHWQAKFPIKDLFPEGDVEPEDAQRLGQMVAKRLREQPGVFGTRTERFAKKFANVDDQDEFNDALSELYDVADMIKVWVE